MIPELVQVHTAATFEVNRRTMPLVDKAATLLRYAKDFRNWPEAAAFHLHQPRIPARPANVLRLRDGHTVHLLDPQAEIRAYAYIYWHRHYDRDFDTIAPNGNVIDLGANVGIYTLYAATRLVPNGQVLAVEANPACAIKLRTTIRSCKNVTTWEGAVGGSGTLWLADESLGASIYRDSSSTRQVYSPGISSEKVLRYFNRVELVKVNMEGAEYPFLLDTADELFAAIDRFAIKWHMGEIAKGHHPDELVKRLQSLGYTIKRHQEIWTCGTLTTGITTASRH